jgi:hypothetical protein
MVLVPLPHHHSNRDQIHRWYRHDDRGDEKHDTEKPESYTAAGDGEEYPRT